MNKPIIFIASPFQTNSGASVRELKVIPFLAQHIKQDFDSDIYLHVPFSQFTFMFKQLSESIGSERAEDEIFRKITQSASILKSSGVLVDLREWERLAHHASRLARSEHDSFIFQALDQRVLSFGHFRMIFREHRDRQMFQEYSNLASLRLERPLVYSCHESADLICMMNQFVQKFRGSAAILLGLAPYEYVSLRFRDPFKSISSILIEDHTKRLYERSMGRRSLKLILSVSAAPLLESGLYRTAIRNRVQVRILRPSTAYDSSLVKYRNDDKSANQAVFFGRLTPQKGLYDLLGVWKLVNSMVPDSVLKIIGAFQSPNHKTLFDRKTKELGVRNLEFIGFLSEKSELYKEVSKARVLVYPSYNDAFPAVVLESLALGLAVVAYDIPAIAQSYRGLEPIFLTSRGDIRGMAELVSKVLNLPDSKFALLHQSELLKSFIKIHGSWEEVARSEYHALAPLLGGDSLPSEVEPPR